MPYLSDKLSNFTTFKRPRQEESSSPGEVGIPQKRFKLDYAYSIVTAPFASVIHFTK